MTWPGGKRWVYSITYDEGCEDLLKHALPIHRRFGIPGHVALLASQVGVRRNVPGSKLRWHDDPQPQAARLAPRRRLGHLVPRHDPRRPSARKTRRTRSSRGRAVLEEAVGAPVTMFCVPGDNTSFPAARAVADEVRVHGNHGPSTNRVNTFDGDLLSLGRVPLHTEYPPPFNSVFDPYKAPPPGRRHRRVAVIDYCHCPMPGKPIHPAKDCTTEELAERFETALRVGGNDVWLAEPNDVVRHILHARSTA